MSELKRVPGLDPHMPSSARLYDYMLGGKDNYAIDREIAHRMLAVAPDTKTLAWFIRQFLVKTVEMVADTGVQQFVDLGTGLPMSPTVHEAARQKQQLARVAYVDNDPIVRAHCDAMLAHQYGASVILADIRQPDDLLDKLKTESGIDFHDPVAVVMVNVLDYVTDHEDPAWIVRKLHDMMAPGSFLVLAHVSSESHPDLIHQIRDYTDGTPCQTSFRSREEVTALLDGFDTLTPGVAPVQDWLDNDLPVTRMVVYGAVGRKP